jgi:hypothetical protein
MTRKIPKEISNEFLNQLGETICQQQVWLFKQQKSIWHRFINKLFWHAIH